MKSALKTWSQQRSVVHCIVLCSCVRACVHSCILPSASLDSKFRCYLVLKIRCEDSLALLCDITTICWFSWLILYGCVIDLIIPWCDDLITTLTRGKVVRQCNVYIICCNSLLRLLLYSKIIKLNNDLDQFCLRLINENKLMYQLHSAKVPLPTVFKLNVWSYKKYRSTYKDRTSGLLGDIVLN